MLRLTSPSSWSATRINFTLKRLENSLSRSAPTLQTGGTLMVRTNLAIRRARERFTIGLWIPAVQIQFGFSRPTRFRCATFTVRYASAAPTTRIVLLSGTEPLLHLMPPTRRFRHSAPMTILACLPTTDIVKIRESTTLPIRMRHTRLVASERVRTFRTRPSRTRDGNKLLLSSTTSPRRARVPNKKSTSLRIKMHAAGHVVTVLIREVWQ